jgi:hypothetical protein
MKPAPDVPHDNLPPQSVVRPTPSHLTHLEGIGKRICDSDRCPAVAQIRVHIHKPPSHREQVLKIKFGPYVDTVYYCQHHFDAHLETFIRMELEHTARVDAWPVREFHV